MFVRKKLSSFGFLYAILSVLVNSYEMLDMIVFCDVLSIKACRRSKYIDLLFMLLSAIIVGLTFVEIYKIVNTENPIVIMCCFI
jgi:hypothetical protein